MCLSFDASKLAAAASSSKNAANRRRNVIRKTAVSVASSGSGSAEVDVAQPCAATLKGEKSDVPVADGTVSDRDRVR